MNSIIILKPDVALLALPAGFADALPVDVVALAGTEKRANTCDDGYVDDDLDNDDNDENDDDDGDGTELRANTYGGAS